MYVFTDETLARLVKPDTNTVVHALEVENNIESFTLGHWDTEKDFNYAWNHIDAQTLRMLSELFVHPTDEIVLGHSLVVVTPDGKTLKSRFDERKVWRFDKGGQSA